MAQIGWVETVSEKIKGKAEVIKAHGRTRGVGHSDRTQARELAWSPDTAHQGEGS